jgi:AraC-like DNA-binding protein
MPSCENGWVIESSSLLRRDGLELADVACRHRRGRGEAGEHVDRYAIVFVRRGCFVRSTGGTDSTLDPTLAYCISPAEEQRYDHPHDEGDDCTAIFLGHRLVESLQGGERTLPRVPIATSPTLDLEHRLLLAAARRGADQHSLWERSVLLVAGALAHHDPRPTESGRPSTGTARTAIVQGARELLASDADRSLLDLAGELAVSPHHLSRIFRQSTGHTVSRHRIRLRVRAALERIAGGDRDLARLAAELGFSDQSHLNRSLRRETQHTPAALRRALSCTDGRKPAT